MMAIIGLLTGPVGKALGIAALVVGLIVGALFLIHQHDAKVIAEQTVADQTARIATMQADYQRNVTALETQAADAAALAQRMTNLRGSINAAPKSDACANSGAIRAVVDGLRRPAKSN